MDIKYRRQHNESFMIIEDSQKLNESYEERMIESNQISNLLPRSRMETNGETSSFYNISKLESLRDFFENEDGGLELVQKVLLYIHLGLDELKAFLINQNHILLTVDTIYIERGLEGFKIKFCYYGGINEEPQAQLREVIQWIMSSLSSGNRDLAQPLCELYSLCLKEDYTILELVEYLNEAQEKLQSYEENSVEIVEAEEWKTSPVRKEIEVEKVDLYEDEDDLNEYDNSDQPLWQLLVDKIENWFVSREPKQNRFNLLQEDFVIEPEMEINEPTVCIRPEDMKCTGKLLYDGDYNEQNFVISKEVFKIGTSENNDAVIGSKTVSRHHARILHKDDGYYIEDLNSTNGTRVNARILEYKNPVRLKALDRILLGDVEYVFM